jgi:diguanylate cyclase (GGDEF)-like protein
MKTNKIISIFVFKILLTLVLIALFHNFNNTKEFNLLNQGYETEAVSDSENGGNSSSHIDFNDKYKVNCVLKEGFDTPYCALLINITDNYKNGIDLNQYHSIVVNVEFNNPNYSGNAPRIYIKNYNSDYIKKDPILEMKFNGVQLNGYRSGTDTIVKLEKFQVAQWWIERFKIPVEQAGAELSNVPTIQIETGWNSTLGNSYLTINKAKLIGRYLSDGVFYVIIAFLWFLSSLSFVFNVYFKEKKNNKILKMLNQNIIKNAHKDELTGAYNRHAIKSFMNDKESDFHKGYPISCVYLDIDHFKRINDIYGHTVGDKVLQEISTVIQSNIRTTDYFSRWGGEEFAIFCLKSEKEDTHKLMKIIKDKINKYNFSHGDQLTCSFGITEIKENETFMEAFDRADKALYEAKNSGRDKIIVH